MKKKLVIKIGTSTLTAGTDKISRGKIEDLARQIEMLKKEFDVIIVSSGAIATARQFITLRGQENLPTSKQALSAIGQPLLMNMYEETFADFGLRTAQCLLSYRDFENETSRKNTQVTIDQLLQYGYVPIINENDTVSIEEIMLGDNDKLSALIAELMQVQLLIIASDIEGVYNKNPQLHEDAELLSVVNDIEAIKSYVQEKAGGQGTGGMMSKLLAAEICKKSGIELWIVQGRGKQFCIDAMEGKIAFTKFLWSNL